MVGLSVCQYFFSLAVMTPDDVLSLDTCSFTSLTLMLGTATTRLLPFTTYGNRRGTWREGGGREREGEGRERGKGGRGGKGEREGEKLMLGKLLYRTSLLVTYDIVL